MTTIPEPPNIPAAESVQRLLDRHENPVRALRTVPLGRPWLETRNAAEYTDWKVEQESWRETAALLHQSEHMADLFVQGPDALRLFRDLSIMAYPKFRPGQAKQFIATSPDGFMIGDGILVYLEEDSFDLIGDATLALWVQFHIETGGYDVEYSVDHPNHWFIPLRSRETPPVLYRYEVQGPNAVKVIEAATGAPVPEVRLFNLTEFTIAGRSVRAIRHGMAGQPGFEFFGPYADAEIVREALLEAGEPFGLTPVGYLAYMTTNLESGWFVVGLPAIFSGESTRAFREWLPTSALASITGSAASEDIEDYYFTPYDLGYGPFISKDHEFIGRAALERLADRPIKAKVTLIWNEDDFGKLYTELVQPEHGLPPQFRPLSDMSFTTNPFDSVQIDGRTIGYATQSGYISADRRFVSLAAIDAAFATPGTEVTILWGDNPDIPHPEIAPHRQVSVRATVAPTPFSDYAREEYRK